MDSGTSGHSFAHATRSMNHAKARGLAVGDGWPVENHLSQISVLTIQVCVSHPIKLLHLDSSKNRIPPQNPIVYELTETRPFISFTFIYRITPHRGFSACGISGSIPHVQSPFITHQPQLSAKQRGQLPQSNSHPAWKSYDALSSPSTIPMASQ